MKRPVCAGCDTKVGPNDEAMHVTTRDDSGVTTMEATICLPCMVRINRDPEFAKRLDESAAKAFAVSVEA